MSIVLLMGQTIPVTAKPLDGTGQDSQATLTAGTFTSSNPAVFTVAQNSPTAAVLTAVGPGAATLTHSATATEPDGVTVENIQGSVTISVAQKLPMPATTSWLDFGEASGGSQ